MNKTKFSLERAIKAVEISCRIEGHNPVKIDPANWGQNSPLNKYRKAVAEVKDTPATGAIVEICKKSNE
jgi:hypothetical protein